MFVLQVDYPNYPASRYLNLVDYCRDLNLSKARRNERTRRMFSGLAETMRREGSRRRRRGRKRRRRLYWKR